MRALPALVNLQMINGASALFLAVQEDSWAVVRFLVARAGASVQLKAVDGMSALHVAAQGGSLRLVRFLVEDCGMGVNEVDFSGLSCLHYACAAGSAEVVAYLLMKKAVIGRDKSGNTPLHSCALNGEVEVGFWFRINY